MSLDLEYFRDYHDFVDYIVKAANRAALRVALPAPDLGAVLQAIAQAETDVKRLIRLPDPPPAVMNAAARYARVAAPDLDQLYVIGGQVWGAPELRYEPGNTGLHFPPVYVEKIARFARVVIEPPPGPDRAIPLPLRLTFAAALNTWILANKE